MKPSEILRQLADMLDAQQTSDTSSIEEPGALSPEITPKQSASVTQGTEDMSGLTPPPEDLFLPPLQMKLELLKKATGVENVYDEEEAEDGQSHSYDELDAIKRNAGISVVAIDALGDDEPLEG